MKMLTNRLDRCYSSSTHAPGYEINYPPPPCVVRSKNGASVGSELKRSDAPPLPPKTVINPLSQKKRLTSDPNNTNQEGPASATWSAGGLTPFDFKASSLLDSHDRFKPERSARFGVQRMKWSESRWAPRSSAGDLFSYSLNPQHNHYSNSNNNNNYGPLPSLPMESLSRVDSMTIADVSPRIALKKVLGLYEEGQYGEGARLLNKLSVGTFRIILKELPIDIFVEAMPHSLPLIQEIYTKIFSAEGENVNLEFMKPQAVLMHMIKFFSREDLHQSEGRKSVGGGFIEGCKKILRVIVVAEPSLVKKLGDRVRSINKTVEGMGQHGLVGTSDESLMPLHEALKLEFQRLVDTYKAALQKLQDLSLANKNSPKSVGKGPAPVNASHQRQLSLKCDEIEERLIKNKSVLNGVEGTLDNNCLDILLGILERRIEVDKEALFHFNQLRKETGDVLCPNTSILAPTLIRYSKGIAQVLEMMREIGKELGVMEDYDDSSDLSGYHSDLSDSAIMASGNSPFVTPRARYNFISRSVRSKQAQRPSLLNSSWTGGRSKGSSGPGSSRSLGTSSFQSSITSGEYANQLHPVTTSGPITPRHVKIKNQLYKNNSLGKVSRGSSAGSESSTSGCGESVSTRNEGSLGDDDLSNDPLTECVECVTLVSVPDNEVISQGVNHRCVKGRTNHSPSSTSTTSTTDTDTSNNELRGEIGALKRQLQAAKSTIYHLEEEKRANQKNHSDNGLLRRVDEIGFKGKGEIEYVRQYGALFGQGRVETMDALDALQQLSEADELKAKLLFSVIVLSFRSVERRVCEIQEEVMTLLKLDGSTGQPTQSKLIQALAEYLSSSQQKFDTTSCVEEVASQLWSTLYDYPCLRKCEGLLKYIRTCVSLAWALSNQRPACVLEFERRRFCRDSHVRFHSSDPNSEIIKTYIWPALMLNGVCIHKGVVVT